jgi:pyruvate formate lyase activating enzyme
MMTPALVPARVRPAFFNDSESKGIVFDIRKFSTQDGPGIRTTVFLKGCPLDCWWCHNPESQSRSVGRMQRLSRCQSCGACAEACPENAVTMTTQGPQTDETLCTLCGICTQSCYSEAREIIGHEMSVSAAMQSIRSDVTFYDESHGGVTFSGGEPLLQPEFLLALLQACRAEDIHTALDTSGYAPWQVIQRVLPYVNLFLYDLKTMDEASHRKYTGVSNRLIVQNLEHLSAEGAPIVLRLPLVPGINDDLDNLNAVARLAAGMPSLKHIDLLPYHSSAAGKYEGLKMTYRLPGVLSPTVQQMESAADIFRSYGLTVHTGTVVFPGAVPNLNALA